MSMEFEQFNPEQEKLKKLTQAYNDDGYVTLYRYENPNKSYDATDNPREGIVSKQEVVGQWFTDNISDLKAYSHMRKPGGRITTVRIPKSELDQYDAMKLEQTKDMDIESGNYIIPDELQKETRIEIPVDVETINPNKFLFKDWKILDEFIEDNVSTSEKILTNV